jgi:hypothetical protein
MTGPPAVYSQTLIRALLVPGDVVSVAPVSGKTFLVTWAQVVWDPQFMGASANLKLLLDDVYLFNAFISDPNPASQQLILMHMTVGSAQLLTVDGTDQVFGNTHWVVGGYVLEGDPPLGPGPP